MTGPVEETVWQARRAAFGRLAAGYEAVRPDWPDATASWLVGTADGGPLAGRERLRVLDLGAGTGKLSRTLVAAGHQVVAADPSLGMLDVLRVAVPGAQVQRAAAEALPLAGASLDAVTVAQAWHWFDAEVAAAECARVLRPGGVLGIGWHVRDARVPWVRELDAMVEPPGESDEDEWEWLPLPEPFRRRERALFDCPQHLTVDALITLAGTWSYVAVRPDREDVLTRIRRLAGAQAGPGGVLVLPHRTRCYRAVRA